MKSDVLERLLIDRAAGELSPDVEELLEAHLQQEPAARREAAEIEETLRLARLALAGQKAVALPGPQPPGGCHHGLGRWRPALFAVFHWESSPAAAGAPPSPASVPSRETARDNDGG